MSLIEKAKDYAMSRRSFLGATATVVAGAAAAVTLPGCGLQKVDSDKVAGLANKQGEWIAAACWHNCGGRCLNKAYVVDGVVVRQKTDDTHPDSPDYPQQRGCHRGRSQRHDVYGADRIKYPMKRKNWAPGGGNKELRGKDEWVRISWDEALDLVAGELKRIKEKYGNKSILGSSRLLNFYGGALVRWGSSSSGAWGVPQECMTGFFSWKGNDRLDWRNAKLIVLWGSNPARSNLGNPTYNLMQAKKAGAKIIIVDPFVTPSVKTLADKHIPCRPGTDTALLLAMAYHMITNNLQDQDFLDRCTVGFDKDHMPEGADPKENFKDYVLGTNDGVPKTPEWASEICGTDPQLIKDFSKEIATTKPMIFTSSFAPARTYRGQQFCQAFLTVGWMTGNVGKPGAGVFTMNYAASQSYGGKTLVKAGGTGLPPAKNPLFPDVTYGPYDGYRWANPTNPAANGMAYCETYDAILNGQYTGTNGRGKVSCDIRLIWLVRDGYGYNFLNQSSDVNKGIKAFRKVDFVVTNDIVLSTISKYADIVLPATTQWEKDGVILQGNPEAIFVTPKVVEPLYETKTEEWMDRELAKRLGLNPDEIYPISAKQQFFNSIAGSQVIKEDGVNYETLATITDKDIQEWGVKGKAQQGKIALNDLVKQGVYQVARTPGDKLGMIQGADFVQDPKAHPLTTKSGKLEIHCQALSDKIAAYGLTTIPPIAKYEPPKDGYEATFQDLKSKQKGQYPFQLITIHYGRRSHSTYDNIPQLREAYPEDFVMNKREGEALGLKNGDTVLVESAYGKVIRPLTLTEAMMPGVVALGEGAWAEIDDATGLDKAGATNTLCGARLSGQGEEPWNTTIVRVEKYNGAPLQPDAEWKQRIIF